MTLERNLFISNFIFIEILILRNYLLLEYILKLFALHVFGVR